MTPLEKEAHQIIAESADLERQISIWTEDHIVDLKPAMMATRAKIAEMRLRLDRALKISTDNVVALPAPAAGDDGMRIL